MVFVGLWAQLIEPWPKQELRHYPAVLWETLFGRWKQHAKIKGSIRYVMVGTLGSAPFDFMMRPATNHKALKFAGWI